MVWSDTSLTGKQRGSSGEILNAERNSIMIPTSENPTSSQSGSELYPAGG